MRLRRKLHGLSASASDAFALPRFAGFGCDGSGAHPVRKIISKRSSVRPSASANPANASAAFANAVRPSAGCSTNILVAAIPRKSVNSRARLAYRTRNVSTSATGSAKPARTSKSPAERTSICGWIRATGRSASAIRKLCRSAGKLPAPKNAPRNNPSGRNVRRINDSAPGRSLTWSRTPALITQSKDASAKGSRSSSACTPPAACANPNPASARAIRAPAGGAKTASKQPRSRNSGNTRLITRNRSSIPSIIMSRTKRYDA